MTESTGRSRRPRARSSHWRAGCPESGHGRFGGRPDGKGPAQQAPRRPADPTRTVRDQFLVELDDDRAARIEHLPELNRLFTAWVETVYHRTVHSETGQPPIERWLGSIPKPLPLPSPR